MKKLALILVLALPAFGQSGIVFSGPLRVEGPVQIATTGNVGPVCTILTPSPLTGGTVGVLYSPQAIATTGCAAPLAFSVISGSLPTSLSLAPSTGIVSGTPTVVGPFNFTVQVIDTNGLIASQAYSITIAASCAITTGADASGTSGQAYSQAQTTSGCSASFAWSISAGSLPLGLSIDPATGLISGTATGAGGIYVFTVKLIANGQTATQNQSISIAAACSITTLPLPSGRVSTAYSQSMTTANCIAPFIFSISSGSLPHLITQNSGTGLLSGTPDTVAFSPFQIQVVDSSPIPQTAIQNQSINITAAAGSIVSNLNCGASPGGTDGPAALLLAWLCSSEADTPMTTATVVPVHAGGNLASAYAGAACGSDIQIDAGITLSMGTTTLAAKGCDDSHWIWIRTVPSGQQPAQGTGTCPQFSNVSSGADYGIYPCSQAGVTTQATTAKLSMSGPIQVTGDHVRFENLEVVNDGTNTSGMSLFVLAGGNKIVIDRNWIHGAPGVQTNNAIDVTSSSNVSIVENYISDAHCLNGPAQQCSEGHGIFGGSGVTTAKIDHNFISAGGQQIFFGGGGPGTGAPQDVEIYYNHGFKPCSWNPSGCRGVPYNGGVGGHFYVVKNQVEFKYINRVVLQGNIWENNWGGSTQVGNAITISPKNQTNCIGCTNLCPTCFTTNITERYDKILYAGQGLQIFNDVNANGQLAAAGNSYSIHDDIYSHLGYAGCFQCNAYFNELYGSTNASATQVMHDVTINHITETLDTLAGSDQLEIGGPATGTLASNLIWKNSIMPAGNFGIGNVGGQTNQCAFSPAASTPKFIACSTGSVYANAVPYASGTSCSGHGCGGTWSGTGTISLADQATAVGYTNFAADNFFISSGPLFHTALDGLTYGADIVTLNQQIANAP